MAEDTKYSLVLYKGQTAVGIGSNITRRSQFKSIYFAIVPHMRW